MTGIRRITLASMAWLTCAVLPAGAQERPRFARVSFEAGPSFDRERSRTNSTNGFALAGGVALGRTFAFTVGAAVEHYPSARAPTTVQTVGLQGLQVLRLEGGGNKTVVSTSAGGRLAVPCGRVEPFADIAFGFASISYETRRYVDATTGAVVYPSRRTEWYGLLSEAGLGVRTRSRKRVDGMLGIRWRAYSQLAEGSSGSSMQARVGIVTR